MRYLIVSIVMLCLWVAPAFATMEMAVQGGLTPPPVPEVEATTMLKGKVLETMTSAGYTYVNLQMEKEAKWVAIPETKVTVGETMEFLPGIEMGSHYSKTLKRTFPNIVFSGGINGPPPKEDKEVTIRKQAAHTSIGLDTTKEDGGGGLAANIKVSKATGENAFTVEEINTKRAALANKRVTVRGKIVKVSKGIMGTNWYHLRDGSGDAAKKTNNLVTTGRTEMILGDTATATGTIHTDKDFGSGYFYEVIMEETTFTP